MFGEPDQPAATSEHGHAFWKRHKVQRCVIDGFVSFWASCPRRVKKANARKAYLRATKVASVEEIAAGLHRWLTWRAAMKRAGRWIPDPMHPATWLNGECWEDEHDSDESSGDFEAGEELLPGVRKS